MTALKRAHSEVFPRPTRPLELAGAEQENETAVGPVFPFLVDVPGSCFASKSQIWS